jgi:N-methylhydantoinase A/oxoprolinase/acetone carboxylase beta subunit
MRYRGQGYEVAVPVPSADLHGKHAQLRAAFEQTYQQLYGRIIPGAPVEVINWRVTGLEQARAIPRPAIAPLRGVDVRLVHRRPVYWSDQYVDTAVYSRYGLQPGDVIEGPAMVEEQETTTAIGPGSVARVDQSLNLLIDMEGATRW